MSDRPMPKKCAWGIGSSQRSKSKGEGISGNQETIVYSQPGRIGNVCVGGYQRSTEGVSYFPYPTLAISKESSERGDGRESIPSEVIPGGCAADSACGQQRNHTTAAIQVIDSDHDEQLDGYGVMSGKEVLGAIFNIADEEELESILSCCNYELKTSLEVALEYNFRARKEPPESLLAGKSVQAPACRYFLSGNCFRSDCKYSHSSEGTICKFWLRGECLKGEFCEFMHQQDVTRAGKDILKELAPEPKITPKKDMHSEVSFPPLSIASPGKAKQRIQVRKVQRACTAPLLHDAQAFPELNVENASRAPAAKKSQPQVDDTYMPAPFSDVVKIPSSAPSAQAYYRYPPLPAPPATARFARTTRKIHTKWLDTGDNVAGIYAKYRGSAVECAIQRNKLISRASEAYMSGNKAAASALSLGAHRLNQKLSELHTAAARNIFNERNKNLFDGMNIDTIRYGSSSFCNSASSSSQERIVDLHGLYPSEAILLLKETIQRFTEFFESYKSLYGHNYSGFRKFFLIVVTGTGHHSRSQKAKILPVIEGWIKISGLRARGCIMEDGRGGVFKIEVA